jgi:RNA polymerase sigma-70 factor (ECF subfamily)
VAIEDGTVSDAGPEVVGYDGRLDGSLRHLRGVLIARHGIDIGCDVHSEVAAYAWENRDRLAAMENPAGYLYRVSQSRARRYRRWGRRVVLPAERVEPDWTSPLDVSLSDALGRLSVDDRTIAVVVHAYGYSYDEAAALLGWSTAAVRNRLHRAMAALRAHLADSKGAAE